MLVQIIQTSADGYRVIVTGVGVETLYVPAEEIFTVFAEYPEATYIFDLDTWKQFI